MAVAHRASIAASTANPTTTFTITIPATTLANDVLFVAVTSRDHTSGTAYPTVTDNDTGGNTWAMVEDSTDRKYTLWWKRATSGTASKTITVAGCVGSCAGGVSVYSGAILSGDPFQNAGPTTNISGDETHSTTSVLDGSTVLFVIANIENDNSVTSVSAATIGAFTQRFEKLSTGGSDCASALWSTIANNTSTGNITWSQTNGATYTHVFHLFEEPSTFNALLIAGD